MKKTLTLLPFLAILAANANAQTLFTYGKHAVSKEEFLRAFNRNNTNGGHSEKDFRDYLELYTRFRLKVQAAYDARLDTLPRQVAEYQQFRNQLAEGFLSDENTTAQLVAEAFERSLEDLRISHIYIPFHHADTAAAWQQVNEAHRQLRAGKDFGVVAENFSKDPTVKTNRGDIGYITVFTLPYELETLAYATRPGAFSKPYRSRLGYHIFKVTDARPAAGRMKAAQIFLAFEPGAGEAEKNAAKKRADSVYQALTQGASFGSLALAYSKDNDSYRSGGIMPEFGTGSYSPEFEKAAFALTKDGDITPPLPSADGYRIVKRLGRLTVNRDKSNTNAMAQLKAAVLADSRIEKAKKVIAGKMIREGGYRKAGYAPQALWAYMDSIYSGGHALQRPGMNDNTLLFSFPGQDVTAVALSHWLQVVRNQPGLAKDKSIPGLLQQYTEIVAVEYYRRHLEQFNPAFAVQAKEFKDGNLLFEIMQREVWDKAPADSTGLRDYYTANQDRYWWGPSADAILFTCSDSAAAPKARAAFVADKNNWRSVARNSDGMVQADSGRYELAQLPITVNGSQLKAGFLSAPSGMATDNVTGFLYIITLYPNRSSRSFEEARGFVINDYQAVLENRWIKQLQQQYPIRVNEAVLKSCWK